MKSRIAKSFQKTIFRRVNKFLIYFYDALQDIFTVSGKKQGSIYLYPELKKMNKLMRNFYKHPEMQITATDNLIPFKFNTDDGVTLDGIQYLANPKSDKWLISCHWFAGDKYWALYWAKPFIELGYNILVFDFRNHGLSQKNQPVTMGYLETKDLMGAIKWLQENHEYEHLGLLGCSMGAYTCNFVAAKYPEYLAKAKLRFVISDVTYGSIKSLLLHIRNVRLNKLLGKKAVAKKINSILNEQNEATGYNWYDIDIFKIYEQDGSKPLAPTFYSHGLNDKLTPPTDTLRLYSWRQQFNLGDEVIIYNFSPHALSLKDHFCRQVYHWLMFENKVMGNDALTNQALAKFQITEERLMNNKEENYEVYTYYLNPQPKVEKLALDVKIKTK
ncbi:alpha/beta hydrolase family protein [Entomoplasma freundtii]|uniref:Alpha/beta hydrolase n=1 Tax=Entomoplasma freundtii TaxID=74700 RepID=A0A2K8NS10_9MOLU|nr:alpha/beta fold hydrolase [Entomoplasma freundtii]ATZ16635.1 alpha/beta hydrolase [Entomoplasma freundtii]TDY58198.1 alpha/beta hydrolase family protein [Entomoplasma freundtii]